MMANEIVDPQFDWVLSYNNFQKFLTAKYGSPQQAMLQTHHYEMVISRTDSASGITTTSTVDIDHETYANNNLVDVSPHLGIDFILGQTAAGQQFIEQGLNSSQTFNLVDGTSVFVNTAANIVSCYDFENNQNEKKRQIKLISRQYLDQIQNEFISLSSNA